MWRPGFIPDDEYLTEYPRDIRNSLPEILRLIPADSIQSGLNCSRRFAYSLRNGERKPGIKWQAKVIAFTAQFARDKLQELNEPHIPTGDEKAILRLVNRLRNSRNSNGGDLNKPDQPPRPGVHSSMPL